MSQCTHYLVHPAEEILEYVQTYVKKDISCDAFFPYLPATGKKHAEFMGCDFFMTTTIHVSRRYQFTPEDVKAWDLQVNREGKYQSSHRVEGKECRIVYDIATLVESCQTSVQKTSAEPIAQETSAETVAQEPVAEESLDQGTTTEPVAEEPVAQQVAKETVAEETSAASIAEAPEQTSAEPVAEAPVAQNGSADQVDGAKETN